MTVWVPTVATASGISSLAMRRVLVHSLILALIALASALPAGAGPPREASFVLSPYPFIGKLLTLKAKDRTATLRVSCINTADYCDGPMNVRSGKPSRTDDDVLNRPGNPDLRIRGGQTVTIPVAYQTDPAHTQKHLPVRVFNLYKSKGKASFSAEVCAPPQITVPCRYVHPSKLFPVKIVPPPKRR
jgi:hypothetical protein